MKNTQKKSFAISLITASALSLLFVLVASNKSGIERFDIYLGALWVLILSFIVILSLAHTFKDFSQDR